MLIALRGRLQRPCRIICFALAATCGATSAHAQEGTVAGPQAASPSDIAATQWVFGLDGVVFATFNHQGGPRGDQEFTSQNWVMTTAARPFARGRLVLSGMFSAEPSTVGNPGYSELFQEGEAYQGLQITDRQHPHDLFMQLAAAWRLQVGGGMGLTLAAAPVGEAALGPPAFMHRPSSADNPTAPLSHHIFDSTHQSTGVVLAGVDRGRFALEGSIFHGREADEHRTNLDFGPIDSWSARVWFRPTPEWSIQASHGFLKEPEQLEPGDQRRTSGSVSWFRQRPSGFTAMTGALGWNVRRYSTVRAVLFEGTHQMGRTSVFGRFEDFTVETEILLFPTLVHRPHPGELVHPLRALTAGMARDVAKLYGFEIGVGGDAVFYGVPEILQFTHGEHPVSFHLFARIRLPARGGRMWNMTMGQVMSPHGGMAGHEGMGHR